MLRSRTTAYSILNLSLTTFVFFGLATSVLCAGPAEAAFEAAEETQLAPSASLKAEASAVPEDLDTASSFGFGHRHGFRGTHFYGGIGGLKLFAGLQRNYGHYNHFRHFIPHVFHYHHPIFHHYGHGHHHGHYGHGYGHFG